MYDQLPSNLKIRNQFCSWKLEEQNGRMTKVPYQTNGKRANPADPQNFTDFATVCAVCDKYDAIVIGIFGDLFAIDIDHCVVGGVVSEMAQAEQQPPPSRVGVWHLYSKITSSILHSRTQSPWQVSQSGGPLYLQHSCKLARSFALLGTSQTGDDV